VEAREISSGDDERDHAPVRPDAILENESDERIEREGGRVEKALVVVAEERRGRHENEEREQMEASLEEREGTPEEDGRHERERDEGIHENVIHALERGDLGPVRRNCLRERGAGRRMNEETDGQENGEARRGRRDEFPSFPREKPPLGEVQETDRDHDHRRLPRRGAETERGREGEPARLHHRPEEDDEEDVRDQVVDVKIVPGREAEEVLVEDVEDRREARERRPQAEIPRKPVHQIDEEQREGEIDGEKRVLGRSRNQPGQVRPEEPEREGPRRIRIEMRRVGRHLEVDEGVPFLERGVRAVDPAVEKQHRRRYESELGLTAYDAATLTQSRELAEYFEATLDETTSDQTTSDETTSAAGGAVPAKTVANWVTGEFSARLNTEGKDASQSAVRPERLGRLLARIQDGTISGKIAKEVFDAMWAGEGEPDAIIEKRGLRQISDVGALEAIVTEVLAANARSVEEFRAGKDRAFNALVGQVMKATKGKANPQQVNELLKKKLAG